MVATLLFGLVCWGLATQPGSWRDTSRECTRLDWPFRTPAWERVVGSTAHQGDDLFAQDWRPVPFMVEAEGLSVLAPMNGTVLVARDSGSGYGGTVVVWDMRELAVRVAHLDTIDVREGHEVVGGSTRLGQVRPSQHERWPHVHIALYGGVRGAGDRPVSGLNNQSDSSSPRRFCISPVDRREP